MAISLTTAANSAAQFLGILDSGESLSSQQLTDAFGVANRLLQSWFQEQSLAMQVMVNAHQVRLTQFIDTLFLEGEPLAVAYTLANGSYTKATSSGPSFIPGSLPQFVDQVTPLAIATGYDRILTLALAIELAPQYGVIPSADLLKQYTESRAAANPMPGKVPIPGMSAESAAAPAGTTE